MSQKVVFPSILFLPITIFYGWLCSCNPINVVIYHFFRALRACPGTHSERYIIRALTSAHPNQPTHPTQPGPRAARAPGVESRHRPLCPESNSSHFSLLLVKDCPLVQSLMQFWFLPLISSLTTSLLTYLAELVKSIQGACQVAGEIKCFIMTET